MFPPTDGISTKKHPKGTCNNNTVKNTKNVFNVYRMPKKINKITMGWGTTNIGAIALH